MLVIMGTAGYISFKGITENYAEIEKLREEGADFLKLSLSFNHLYGLYKHGYQPGDIDSKDIEDFKATFDKVSGMKHREAEEIEKISHISAIFQRTFEQKTGKISMEDADRLKSSVAEIDAMHSEEIKEHSEENSERIRSFTHMLFVSFLFSLFGIVFIWHTVVYKAITKPLNELRSGVKQISEGKLKDKINIPTADEFQEFADEFNIMAERLSEKTTRLETTAEEQKKLIHELEEALKKIEVLSGLLPICSYCKKIRNEKGEWNRLETYISEHSKAQFTHGICDDCIKKFFPKFNNKTTGE